MYKKPRLNTGYVKANLSIVKTPINIKKHVAHNNCLHAMFRNNLNSMKKNNLNTAF